MTINVTYSQFLLGNGVPRENAIAVGAMIESKIWKREPLTREEVALTALYLDRPNANEIAERHIGAAILASNLRNTVDQQKPRDLPVSRNAPASGFSNVMGGANSRSAGRVPVHTPEWSNPQAGDPGVPKGVRVLGWDYKTKQKVEGGNDPSTIRKLAAEVAVGFASAGSANPTV